MLQIPILTFHSLDDGPPPLSFPPSLFRRGMEKLHAAGFRSVTVGEAARRLRNHGGNAPSERLLALAFDDGCQSFYEQAFPVLRELGYHATAFVITGSTVPPFMDGKRRLSWDQLGEMHESGMEIGAHTMTHPDLTRLDRAAIVAEIEGCKAAIADNVGAPAESFAYPFGHSNELTRTVARAYFDCACTTDLRVADERSDLHALGRIEMHYFRNQSTFSLLSSSWLKPYLGLRGVARAAGRALRARND